MNRTLRWAKLRPFIVPGTLWLVALVILALAAAGVRANTSSGPLGSTDDVPLLGNDINKRAAVHAPTLDTAVTVWQYQSTSKSYVAEVKPVKVVEDSLSDFNLSNPGDMAGMRVFYLTYTVTYLRGAPFPVARRCSCASRRAPAGRCCLPMA